VSPDLDDPLTAFREVFGEVTLEFWDIPENREDRKGDEVDIADGCFTKSSKLILCNKNLLTRVKPEHDEIGIDTQNVAHEFGHVLSNLIITNLWAGLNLKEPKDKAEYDRREALLHPYKMFGKAEISVYDEGSGEDIVFAGKGVPRSDKGFVVTYSDGVKRTKPWQQNTKDEDGEEFADMFLNWVFDSFANDPAGAARYNWMDENMADWIYYARHPYDPSWEE
jgi:hypothetical protein